MKGMVRRREGDVVYLFTALWKCHLEFDIGASGAMDLGPALSRRKKFLRITTSAEVVLPSPPIPFSGRFLFDTSPKHGMLPSSQISSSQETLETLHPSNGTTTDTTRRIE